MGKTGKPRSGSMQFWPRKRAKKEIPHVRSWVQSKVAAPLGFGGYKVGMTHITYQRVNKNLKRKGVMEEIACPVTVIECPPLKIAGIRSYKKGYKGLEVAQELAFAVDKVVGRKKSLQKKVVDVTALDSLSLDGVFELRLIVYAQPSLTGIGKKKPEIFELPLGGKLDEQLSWAKEHVGKEIRVSDVFKPGQQVDAIAVTKGKGFQGPVKRFGVALRAKKSEKVKRGPGSLGPWCGQGHIMYRVAHAGQTGYHLRTEFNKWLLYIGEDPKEILQKAGFLHYGNVKNSYLLVKGSVQGPTKRFIVLRQPRRPNSSIPSEAPALEYVHNVVRSSA